MNPRLDSCTIHRTFDVALGPDKVEFAVMSYGVSLTLPERTAQFPHEREGRKMYHDIEDTRKLSLRLDFVGDTAKRVEEWLANQGLL